MHLAHISFREVEQELRSMYPRSAHALRCHANANTLGEIRRSERLNNRGGILDVPVPQVVGYIKETTERLWE